MTESTGRYISTSVTDAKASLERCLESDPVQAARSATDLLEALQGKEGQASRRKVAAGVLRKAAKALEAAK